MSENHAENVRALIDCIDETTFQNVGKLFDRMADEAQRAMIAAAPTPPAQIGDE